MGATQDGDQVRVCRAWLVLEPVRLQIAVPDEFLERPDRRQGRSMMSMTVNDVSRLA